MTTIKESELAAQVSAKLRELSHGANWDATMAFVKPSDPKGRIRVRYLAHQGEISVSSEDATAYLAWLEAGNVGTIMSWARQLGRKLK
jgi:hypothetical protein